MIRHCDKERRSFTQLTPYNTCNLNEIHKAATLSEWASLNVDNRSKSRAHITSYWTPTFPSSLSSLASDTQIMLQHSKRPIALSSGTRVILDSFLRHFHSAYFDSELTWWWLPQHQSKPVVRRLESIRKLTPSWFYVLRVSGNIFKLLICDMMESFDSF